jgi:hypothetical protein
MLPNPAMNPTPPPSLSRRRRRGLSPSRSTDTVKNRPRLWAEFEAIDHERFMREALAESKFALESGDLPIGAVIVCEGTVVARGRNRIRSDSSQLAHAEILALRSGGDCSFAASKSALSTRLANLASCAWGLSLWRTFVT